MSGWLKTLLIITGILGIILMLRFGVDAVYENEVLTVRAQLNFIYFTVYSSAKKKKKKAKKSEKTEGKPKEETKPEKPPKKKKAKKKLTFEQIREITGMLSKAVKRVLKGIRVDDLIARVTLAGQEPDKLGVLYGRLSAASGTIHVMLDDLINLKNYSVLFEPDFFGEKTKAEGRVHITLTNFAIVCAVFGLLSAFIRYSIKHRQSVDKKQGGQYERRDEASGQRNNGSDNGEDQADG